MANEQLELWGQRIEYQTCQRTRHGKDEYESFIDKFKLKHTTDDCFTPQEVYDCVVEWVDENLTSLKGKEIIRPFFPGGDFENYHYPPNGIVIDNPPFSINAKIVDFYQRKKIPFFLFANHLTLFGRGKKGVTAVVASATITYENGAKVSTSFLTNLCPDTAIYLAADLQRKIRAAQKKERMQKTELKYDKHLVSAALLGKEITKGKTLKIKTEDVVFLGRLSSLFGGGALLSDRALKALKALKEIEEIEEIEIPLTNTQKNILETLNKKNKADERQEYDTGQE